MPTICSGSAWGDGGPSSLRPLKRDPDVCEMKRLYVRPNFRGIGFGRQLVDRILAEARDAGYRAMRLDTLSTMIAAQDLYRRIGFREIPAYYPNPLPGVVYLELELEKTPWTDPSSKNSQPGDRPCEKPSPA